jgi:general secretion pathway protein B
MSFILEALRKSERERQRGDVPAISNVPIAVARRAAPSWAIAAIALLCVALIAVAWGWWQTFSSSHAAGRAPVLAAAPPSVPAQPAPRVAATQAPQPAAHGEHGTQEQPPSAAGASIALRDLAAPAPTSAQRGVASPAAATTSPLLRPSVGELRAEGIEVPELTLELHVYSDDPTQRFVFINGNRYGEGDVLKEGPKVVEILPEGVALSTAGRDFLLPRN